MTFSSSRDTDRAWYFEHVYGPFWEKQVQIYGLSGWHLAMTRRMLDTAPQGPVLEVAAGTGFPYAGLLAEQGRPVVGIDIARSLAAQGRGIMRATVADAARLPFARNVFALVYCLRSTQYFDDLRRCIQEMERVLSSGGVLFIDLLNAAAPSMALKFMKDATIWRVRLLKRRLLGQSRRGVVIESRPAWIGALARRWKTQGFSVELYGMHRDSWQSIPRASLLGIVRFTRILAMVRKP